MFMLRKNPDQCATLCAQLVFEEEILAQNPGRVPCQVILLLNLQ